MFEWMDGGWSARDNADLPGELQAPALGVDLVSGSLVLMGEMSSLGDGMELSGSRMLRKVHLVVVWGLASHSIMVGLNWCISVAQMGPITSKILGIGMA